MRTLLLFVGIICVSSISCGDFCNGKKENLEMQAMCSKGAKAFFNEHYPPVPFVQGIEYSNSFSNHYNNKLNKCFILINEHRYSTGKESIVSDSNILYDVYEAKEYALLSNPSHIMGDKEPVSSVCEVLGTVCNAKDFYTLVKPYMEE